MARLTLAAYYLAGLTLTVLAVIAIGLVYLRMHGDRVDSVQTASMVPTFRPGDSLIISPTKKLKLGQIVSYRSPLSPKMIISHRLIAINKSNGWLTTRGDSNKAADPSFPPNLVVGRVTWLLPNFGRLQNFLTSRLGLCLVIYLPAVSIIFSEVKRITTVYAQPFYSVRL